MWFLFGFLMSFVLRWIDPALPWWVAIPAIMGAAYFVVNITRMLRPQ